MRIIDTKGQKCPAPLMAAKKALNEADHGETFKVVTASSSAADNISRFLKDNRTTFSVEQDNGTWTIQITRT